MGVGCSKALAGSNRHCMDGKNCHPMWGLSKSCKCGGYIQPRGGPNNMCVCGGNILPREESTKRKCILVEASLWGNMAESA